MGDATINQYERPSPPTDWAGPDMEAIAANPAMVRYGMNCEGTCITDAPPEK